MNAFSQKSFKVLMAIFFAYAILVASHKGEFWPFSIYPMFSQAGQPWTRALVQDASQTPDRLLWQTTSLQTMPGPVVTLKNTGVEQIDFANFISKTDHWYTQQKQALHHMFSTALHSNQRWMVMKVRGHLTDGDSVVVEAIPFLLITPDSVQQNPRLAQAQYANE